MQVSKTVKAKHIGFFLGPLLFTFILIFTSDELIAPGANKVIALAAWMITWWILECAPVAVTALLPLAIFPALGTLSITEASIPYANPVVFLFMGGFMIALALEKHKLHERIAINLIRITGTSGNGIILGFTLASGLISMWISNTATALMMLPIAISVIQLLRNPASESGETLSKGERNFALGLMLSIAYAANIGGMGTIIGTPPNVVFVGYARQIYNHDISFLGWAMFGIPIALLMLLTCYILITRILFPNRIKSVEGSKQLITTKLLSLGKLKKEEKLVLIIFCLTSFFWIFQQVLNNIFEHALFNDTNIAVTGGLLMFLVPVNFLENKFLLVWEDTQKLPWGILILFGGGICLAKGMETTGIIKAIGDYISSQHNLPLWQLLLILIVTSVVLTEFMSNVALVTIIIPVVFGIADGLHYDPYVLGLPVTLAASCAFMFPISTPPNAIVFASGHIKMKDMMRAGALLNAASILIILLLSLLVLKDLNI
ncbi:MAG TPA: DASS family sodium-coupled anion symporter [Chryseolinea sp.]|nr:DASS family sodium-coupled anion symporter [Chryseolinea sp.]HPM30156.1 DASS family sodium-coupled anion symporter [Chryseolinea sp.]